MYVTSLAAEGLRASPELRLLDLDRAVSVSEGVAGVAALDALDVVAASLDPARLQVVLQRFGFASADSEIVEEDGFPVQAQLGHPEAVRAWVDDLATRRVTVSIEMALDPPLFGSLRQHAVRDPRLVAALGGSASLAIKVGWLFTVDRTAVSVALLEARVGEVSFSIGEPPTWLPSLLKDLPKRFHRLDGEEPLDAVVARLFEAGLSGDPDIRARFERIRVALQAEPFSLPPLSLLQGPQLGFGPDLLRVRQLGPAAREAVRYAEAVYLRAPDVLGVEGVSARSKDWLHTRMEGDDAPIEQVFSS